MLSISDPKRGGAGGGYYFKYYQDHSDQKGIWYGEGAKLLGLRGEIKAKHFNNLLNGYSPDGKRKLVQNAGKENRQGFWDLTFSVPKPLSVLLMAAPEEAAKEIKDCIRSALETSLDHLQNTSGLTRTGKQGTRLEPAALTFGLFWHDTSRAEDPQFHWHCALINVGGREDGSTGALYTRTLFDEKMNAGAIFQIQLVHELTSRMGLEIEPAKVGFHIKGVPKEICDIFSKRRKEVEAYLQQRGRTDAISAKAAALDTRGKKRHTNPEKLYPEWRSIAGTLGFGEKEVSELLKKAHEKLNEQTKERSQEKVLDEATSQHAKETKTQADHGREGHSKEQTTQQSGAQRDGSKREETKADHNSDEHSREGTARPNDAQDEDAKKQKSQSNRGRTKQKKKESGRTADYSSRRTKRPGDNHRPLKQRLEAFEKAFEEALNRIYVENQTRSRVMRMATRLAKEHGVDFEAVERVMAKAHLPIHGRFYRIEWHKLFPMAPKWNPASKWVLPRIVLRDPPRRWNKILWSKPIWGVGPWKKEIRIQERRLFPGAPKWSPFQKMALPALRITPRRPPPEARKEVNEKHKERSR